nr:hypothetical protein [Acidimicrobiia bacterium]
QDALGLRIELLHDRGDLLTGRGGFTLGALAAARRGGDDLTGPGGLACGSVAGGEGGDAAAAAAEAEPIIKEADPELERLLAEEEEIERLTRASEHAETPHFRGDAE